MPGPALTKGPLDRAVSSLRVSEAPPHTPLRAARGLRERFLQLFK